MDSKELKEIQAVRDELNSSWSNFTINALDLNELYRHVALLTNCVDNILNKFEQEEQRDTENE